ncbi:MAG: DUF2007 domain-containing protein [Pseudomonadota bacterium]
MALVSLITPNSEVERLATVALLEANGIPCLVRGGAYGGLFPGGQQGSFNAQTILVPEEQLHTARLLLAAPPIWDLPPDEE